MRIAGKEGKPYMPTIRAIVSDLDDTLLNEHHQMTARTEQTLRRLLSQGIKVILASGRSAASMRPIVRQIDTPYPYIAYNGAQIVNPATGGVLFADEIALELAREVLAWFEGKGIYVQYYAGDDWYCQTRCDISDEYGRSSGVTGIEAGMRLSEHIRRDVPKVLAVCEPDVARALIAQGNEAFAGRLNFTTSKPYFIEVTSPTANKGNAVRRLAEHLGLTPDDTICAGDSLNDLSMLEWTKLPVTVANGRDPIKAMAWKIAGDGHRDGLAILLDELIEEA